jgi:hypothetical protein
VKRRRAVCPECLKVFPVKDEPGTDGRDVFPRHTLSTFEMCSGSRWIVEQEDYVVEAP